ncbi:fimbrillin family protein [Bacteroides sp. 51]|uniref:fimbrillin family protein n=1 Tax=Bacteroides sp. 51 TaxID=2302938 RepID=UPI0013D55D1B|nr:fimbrillin family protein [Bacteroides sp. 51]NDV80524.1 fimbrillin family protein [Bacteroides sp. 51]
MKQLLYLTLGLVLLSCSKEDTEPFIENAKIPISFSYQREVGTRATDYGFETGDRIGVYITKWNGNNQTSLKASGNYEDNKPFTYANNAFTYSPQIYFPSDGSKVDIYAYYPQQTGSSASQINFKVKLNQASGSNFTLSDFMITTKKNCSPSTQSIPLSFTHSLSRINIALDQATLPSGTPQVFVCGMASSVKLDLVEMTYATGNESDDITACPNGIRNYKVIVPPQTIKAGTNFIKIVVGGKTYTVKKDYDINLETGLEYSYTISF